MTLKYKEDNNYKRHSKNNTTKNNKTVHCTSSTILTISAIALLMVSSPMMAPSNTIQYANAQSVNLSITGSNVDPVILDSANWVHVVGNYAYVTSGTAASLAILDISDHTDPVIVGSVIDSAVLQGVNSVHVAGNYAYVTSTVTDRLAVIDVSDPITPVIVGSAISNTLLDEPYAAHVVGNYAFVANGNGPGLVAIDVFNPTNPTIIDTSNGIGNTGHVHIVGNYAYVTGWHLSALEIIDISDPANLTVVGTVSDPQLYAAVSVYVDGEYAYVGLSSSGHSPIGIIVIDVSNPAIPQIETSITDNLNLDGIQSIQVVDDYAYVTSYATDRLAVLDVSDPTTPIVAGAITGPTLDNAHSVDISGNHAYVASTEGNSLTVIQIPSAATSSSTSATGSMVLVATCGLQLTAGSAINYGSILPGDTSAEQSLTLYNTGNIGGQSYVHGTDWIDDTPQSQMNVHDTKYSIVSGNYTAKTPLALEDQALTILDPQTNTDTFWQIQANPINTTFSGGLSQTINFSVTC